MRYCYGRARLAHEPFGALFQVFLCFFFVSELSSIVARYGLMNMLPIRAPVIMQLPRQNLSINQTCQANGVWEVAKTLGPGSLAEMRS